MQSHYFLRLICINYTYLKSAELDLPPGFPVTHLNHYECKLNHPF